MSNNVTFNNNQSAVPAQSPAIGLSDLQAILNAEPSMALDLPRKFWEQYTDELECFVLPNAFFANRLGNLYVEAPKVVDQEGEIIDVQFSVNLFAVLNPENKFVPLQKGGSLAPGNRYLNGFRSNAQSARAWVESGHFTEEDYQHMLEYALRMKAYGDAAYNKSTKSSVDESKSATQDRMILVPKSGHPKPALSFHIVVRQNPQTGAPVFGMELAACQGLELGGLGIGRKGGAVADKVEVARVAHGERNITIDFNKLLQSAPKPAPKVASAPVAFPATTLVSGLPVYNTEW